MASTATLTALTRAGGKNNGLQLNCKSYRHQGAKTDRRLNKGTHMQDGCTPFFSCKHREDRPRPLIGYFTFSPIQDVSVLCTEPANETLRTADSDSKKKKKSNYLQYTKKLTKAQRITIDRYTITKIFALLAGAIKRWEALEKQMVRLTTNSVWGHPVNICSLWWAFNIWICEDDFLYASGINRIPCINLDSNAQLHSYKHSYVLNINISIHENNCRVSGGNNCISYHIGQVRYKLHTC